MIIYKKQTIYVCKEGLNIANLYINHKNGTYEILRRAVKNKKFIDKIKNFAETILNK